MPVLNIRNLPADVHARLRIRAARHRRSMEAEARAIIADAVAEPTGLDTARELQAFVAATYEGRLPAGVVDGLIAERRREAAREASEEQR